MVEVTRLTVEGYVNAVAWAVDGSRMAALTSFGNVIKVWDTATWGVINAFERYGGAYSGNSFAFLWDGSLLLPAPIGRSPDPPYQELYLSSFEQIDADSGKRIRYIADKFFDRGRRRIMDIFTVSRDGVLVAGIPTGNPSLISLFDTRDWSLTRNVDLSSEASPRGFARSLAIAPEGDKLAIGTANGFVKVVDVASGDTLLERGFSDRANGISAMAFSQDGRHIAIGGSQNFGAKLKPGKMLRILELGSSAEVSLNEDEPIGNIFSIAWASDQSFVVASGDVLKIAQLDETGSLATLKTFIGQDFYSVTFAPDGRLAASKGSTILVYDFAKDR